MCRKIKKVVKGLLAPNPNLTPILNKARIFNAYMAWYEVACMVFYIGIAGRTNQAGLVAGYVLQSLVCMVAGLYIHVNHRIKYFYKSIQGMVGGQIYAFLLAANMLTRFAATGQACRVVNEYYEKIPNEKAKANSVCIATQLVYYLWAGVCLATLLVRLASLSYLVRGYKFLKRKN